MHWGERRYQNYDGTWTEEGLARRRANGSPYKYKASNKEKAFRFENEYDLVNEKTFDSDYNTRMTAKYEGIIKKNTPAYRVTTSLNEDDKYRTYASITQGGADFYRSLDWDYFFLQSRQ